MNRIVTPDGMIPQGDGAPRPPTLEERLQEAVQHWQYKRRDLAFATALNCIAYLSTGLVRLSKSVLALEEANHILSVGMEHLTKENTARKAENEELKTRLAQLEART